MLLAFLLMIAGGVTASGQKIYKADLAEAMFKAWDSNLPGANEVADPDPEPKAQGEFGCAFDLYKTVEAGATIYGSPNVYCMWYADLTGTQTMTVTATPGMKIRLMLNRVPFEEGGPGDADGGAYIEWIEEVGESGVLVFDFTQKAELVQAGYIHLNAIKLPWGAPSGIVKGIKLKGTVVPVTGILSLINNGDAESDDLSSFPVSYDGPNNGDTANDLPTIVDNGYVGKGLKVTSHPEATQTWHTQFYLKFDEALKPGDNWRLVFYAKADHDAVITTSAQGQPRAWQSGISEIGNINVTTEWQRFEYSGTVTDDMGKNDGWLSMAFDLNNGEPNGEGGFNVSTGSNDFFFDEIEFGRDLGGASALANVKAGFQNDVVRIDFGGDTNIKDMVKAADGKRVIFPNECASASVNGEAATLFSVEGRPDGFLYVFINEPIAENETDKVLVSFTNPTDENLRIKYTGGAWEGEAVPSVANLECAFSDGLGENYTYLADIPVIASANPEDGSFNLPVGLKEFKVTFGTNADASQITAKLDGENLTVSPNSGFATEFTFTRTAAGDLSNGTHILKVDNVWPEANFLDAGGTYELKLSFGPVVIDENDKEEVLMTDKFSAAEGNGPGWLVNKDDGTLQPANSGSGCRLMHERNDAFTTDILYLAQRNSACPSGVALYGLEDDYQLVLEAKTYHLTLRASQWDREDDRTLRVQVVKKAVVNTTDGSLLDTAEGDIIAEDYKPITKKLASKEAESFDLAVKVTEPGNYVVRLVPGNKDGNPAGYNDGCAIGNIKFEYLPDVAGVQEMKAVENALTEAKGKQQNMGAERYAGEALTALGNTIAKIENEKTNFTSPSACQAAVDELAAAIEALKKHYDLCNTYDDLAKRLADVVRINKDNKFNTTEDYATVKALAEKYHAESAWVNVSDDPEVENWQKQVSFDVLTEDAALNDAVAELNDIVIYTEKTFTILDVEKDKESKCGITGVAAITERLRLGAETLKVLGADDSNEMVSAAYNALDDDDQLAEFIKLDVTKRLYAQLMDPANDLFAESFDESTLETVAANPIDLTVFVKNPNLYARENTVAVEGWDKITGNAQAWSSWTGEMSHSTKTPYAEDCKLHPGWHSKASVEQTITDLPAGVYTIQFKGDDNDATVGSYGYVKTSKTPAVAEGAELDMAVNYAGYSYIQDGMKIEKITVTDGQLTLGFAWGPECQAFMEGVTIQMTGKAEGFDYGKAYEDLPNAVETVKAATVSNVAVFDLNGRRVARAAKGFNIVKKTMSDGSVRILKVIVK